ncbi:MAG: bifunctional tetrahydrofolate synthase/dihydrofolate synthase [Gammaproteobacteria bacterium HGW-Gammaproteobacteria-3]|nr:MAG: bifunctional tetrahydrofolate synthase/dihydrofolate synthase [Gammaproteobacteria bacterium HGW-Gammaproteobacteria-3]
MPCFNSLQEWLNWQESLHPKTIDLGLERVRQVFRALYPDYQKPPTITVAGTNGKGSCVAFLESVYRAQGYRVGTYTSPHILNYNERIKIDGEAVADDLICSAFARIESVRNAVSLSYFEFGTLAALDIFSRSEVAVQLLEVGLGGRLDAVNIIDPDAAIITSIGIDHADWLGHSRELIGREKAGIFRAGVPAIIGDTQPPDTLADCAKASGALIFYIGRDFGYQKQVEGWDWFGADLQIKGLPEPNLKGEHQYRNAASALFAVTALQERLPVSVPAIRQGLEKVELTGRFQLIDSAPPVLLDVGHNPQAVGTLVEHLRAYYAGHAVHAVFSMMKDKDIRGVIEIMKPVVEVWYFAPLPNNQRCASETQMREAFAETGIAAINFGFADFNEALNAARNKAGQGDLLLVFGSFFLVSEYLAGLQ